MGGITNILQINIEYLEHSDCNKNAIEKLLSYKSIGSSPYDLCKNKNDEYYLTYNSKPITSSYSTQKEAVRLVESSMNSSKDVESIAIFLSCSFPTHIEYFFEHYKHKIIFVIEQDIALLHLVLSSIELKCLKSVILLADERASDVSNVVDNVLEDLDVKKVGMCAHPRATAVSDSSKAYYSEVVDHINEVLKKKIMSLATYYYHAPLWSKNILYNILHNKGNSVVSILNIAKSGVDIPVLIISAGSSIDEQADNIRRLSESHFTLVLSNALGFVVANNIKIDAIVSTDGGFYATYHYMALEYAAQNNINVITTYTSYAHANCRFAKDNVFYFSHNELFEKHFCKNSYYIPMEGSVIIVALKIASLLAKSEIVVAGADFSFSDEKTHSKYSMSFKTDHSLQGKLTSLYNLNENRQGVDKTVITSYSGKNKITNFSLYEYQKHFEYAVSRMTSKAKVYCLTKSSAKVANVDLYKMRDNYKKLDYTIEPIDERIDCGAVRTCMKGYFDVVSSGNLEAIVAHEYTMLIAPWQLENYTKNASNESCEELVNFIGNWAKSVEIFLQK